MKFESTVINQWKNAIKQKDLDAITGCYHDDAVLLPTFSNKQRLTAESRRNYFQHLLKLDQLEVSFDAPLQTYQDNNGLEIVSGIYVFSYRKDNQLVEFQARYTFVIEPSSPPLIRHHHSSAQPDSS